MKKTQYRSMIEVAQSKYYKQRMFKNTFCWFILFLFTLLTTSIALFVILFIVIKGLEDFHIKMLVINYNQNNLRMYGWTGIVGPLISTFLLLFLVLIFSILIALYTSIFLNEYCNNKKLRSFIIYFCSICNGIPSIIFGIFGLLVFVYFIHFSRIRFGILASSFTLSLVILPTMVLGFYTAIKEVPNNVRINSYCLGATRLQTIYKVIIPIAITSMIGTIILSASRALGEAAPVLFTIGGANAIPTSALSTGNTLTLLLFENFRNPVSISFLFSIALIILFLVLVINILFRFLNVFLAAKSVGYTSWKQNILDFFSFKYSWKLFVFKSKVVYYKITHIFSPKKTI